MLIMSFITNSYRSSILLLLITSLATHKLFMAIFRKETCYCYRFYLLVNKKNVNVSLASAI